MPYDSLSKVFGRPHPGSAGCFEHGVSERCFLSHVWCIGLEDKEIEADVTVFTIIPSIYICVMFLLYVLQNPHCECLEV